MSKFLASSSHRRPIYFNLQYVLTYSYHTCTPSCPREVRKSLVRIRTFEVRCASPTYKCDKTPLQVGVKSLKARKKIPKLPKALRCEIFFPRSDFPGQVQKHNGFCGVFQGARYTFSPRSIRVFPKVDRRSPKIEKSFYN